MVRRDDSCSSVRTFLATINVTLMTKPRILILENVDSVASGNSAQGELNETSNLNLVIQALHSCDGGAYTARVFRMNTSDFLLPQSRLEANLAVGL